MHAHGASRRTMPVHISTMHMRVGHVEHVSEVSQSSRLRLNRTWKVSIIYAWLVKTLHNVLSSFARYLVLFLPSWLLLYIDFVAFSFSVSPNIGCVQDSTRNTYVRRTSHAVLPILHCQEVPFFPVLIANHHPRVSVHVTHEFLWLWSESHYVQTNW